MIEQFWMVAGPDGSCNHHRYESREDAESEAERLARENIDKDFFVLEAVVKFRRRGDVRPHRVRASHGAPELRIGMGRILLRRDDEDHE